MPTSRSRAEEGEAQSGRVRDRPRQWKLVTLRDVVKKVFAVVTGQEISRVWGETHVHEVQPLM